MDDSTKNSDDNSDVMNDVKQPNDVTPDATSRPIIQTQPVQSDPMVNNAAASDESSDASSDALPNEINSNVSNDPMPDHSADVTPPAVTDTPPTGEPSTPADTPPTETPATPQIVQDELATHTPSTGSPTATPGEEPKTPDQPSQ